MDSIRDILHKKADKLDIEGKRDEIALAKQVLTRYFTQGVRPNKITTNRSLMVKVNNASLASEVRMQQVVLLEELNRLLKSPVERIIIKQ